MKPVSLFILLAAFGLSGFAGAPSQARPVSDDELANFQVSVSDSLTKDGQHGNLAASKCSVQNISVKFVDDQDSDFKGKLQTIKLPIEPVVLVVSSMSAEISDQDPHQITFLVPSHHDSVLIKVVTELSADKKNVKYLTQQDYSVQQSGGPLVLDGESNCGDMPARHMVSVKTVSDPKAEIQSKVSAVPVVNSPLPDLIKKEVEKKVTPIIVETKPEMSKQIISATSIKPVIAQPKAVVAPTPLEPQGDPSPQLSRAKQVVKDDLKALSQFNFDQVSVLHQQLFGGADAASVVKFFSDRVHRVVWKQGVMAAVYPGTDTMAVGPLLFSDSVPQIIRLSTYIHEARHTEPFGGWPHSFCPKPYNFVLNGSLTFRLRPLENSVDERCDGKALGAYGVEYVFLRSIVNSCTNCSDKMKLDAKIYADYQTITRITDPVAVEQLLRDGNLDFNEATSEVVHVLTDKIQSGLIFTKWLKRCEDDRTCLD